MEYMNSKKVLLIFDEIIRYRTLARGKLLQLYSTETILNLSKKIISSLILSGCCGKKDNIEFHLVDAVLISFTFMNFYEEYSVSYSNIYMYIRNPRAANDFLYAYFSQKT